MAAAQAGSSVTGIDIDLAARINDNKPYYVVYRIGNILDEMGTTLGRSRRLLLE